MRDIFYNSHIIGRGKDSESLGQYHILVKQTSEMGQ
jgi:hypothetical protein